MIPVCWCRPGPHFTIKISSKLSLCTTSTTMKGMSARPPVRVISHLMILKSFQPHLQLIVVNNNLEGIPASVGAVNPCKHCLQETLHCRFGAWSSWPRTLIFALRIQLQRSAMDKRCEHFLFKKLSGLPTPATTLTCVIQTQPALKSGSRRSAAMWCRSIGYSGLVHSVHQSDQSFSGNRSGCLCKHATANLRAKSKSPKLSSWEDSSPSRSTANNQKCSHRKLVTIPFALPPFVLEPMHYQCLCKSSINSLLIKFPGLKCTVKRSHLWTLVAYEMPKSSIY